MAYCHEHRLSVVPQGGNTGLVGGCLADGPEPMVILNLKRLNQITKMDHENNTAEVGAGCIVQVIQDAAIMADRLFPLSFGAQGSAQIGGAISTNAGGLNVLRYGMARDLVLGVEVVLPDGQIIDTRSQLRKDNRGLDMTQLFVGTEGVLGVITAASIKLFPGTQSCETALLSVPDLDAVVALFNLARSACADLLSAFEFFTDDCLQLALAHQDSLRNPLTDRHEYCVLMELTCSGPLELRALLETFLAQAAEDALITDGALASNIAQSQEFWAIREAMIEAQAATGRHLRTDVSVPITSVPAFITAATTAVTDEHPDWQILAYGHVGDGNIHFNALPPAGLDDTDRSQTIKRLLGQIYEVVDRFDGSISAEHGIGRNRLEAHLKRQSPVERSIMMSMKALLDPKSILNPGCLLPAPNR